MFMFVIEYRHLWGGIALEYRHWNLNYEKRFLKESVKEQKQFLKGDELFLKGDEVFLKETAEFTKEFIKELKYACLWYLSNRGYKGVG